MTDRPTEALARGMCASRGVDPDLTLNGKPMWEYMLPDAERTLADPGPLLAALAAAGVLREVYTLARHDPKPSMSGPKVQRAGESPDRTVMERVSSLPHSEGRWVERRYVTAWQATDARP